MPKHPELVNIKVKKGRYRLCLDRINDSQYRLVWRGNKKSPDAFRHEPAHFEFDMLGKLLNKAIKGNKISANQLREFLVNMFRNGKK